MLANDTLAGEGDNDVLDGGDGNDNLTGGSGKDTVYGGAGDDFLAGGYDSVDGFGGIDSIGGKNDIDLLFGGTGKDTFGISYTTDDGDPTTAGTRDYSLIKDFNPQEDTIRLNGAKSNYILKPSPPGLPQGTAIYFDKPGNQPDELLAIVENKSGLKLSDRYFTTTVEDNFYGTSQDDYFDAGIGNDYLRGGDGNDTFLGGDDNDYSK